MSKATKYSALFISTFVLTAVLNYAFGVALSWFFSPEQYGVLGVAQSLLLLSALAVGSGFAWTTASDLAANGVSVETRRRYQTAMVANVVLAGLLSAGFWLAYISGWIPLGPAYRTIVPLAGLTTVILAARSVANGAARGLYHFKPVAINLTGEVVVKILFGLGLVAAGFGVSGVMAAFVLGAAGSLIHSLWILSKAGFTRNLETPVQVNNAGEKNQKTGRFLNHGLGLPAWFDRSLIPATIPLFLGMLGPALILNLDILGLKMLAPSGRGDLLAGYYQAAVILARTPVFIAQSLTMVLFSYVAKASTSEQQQTGRFVLTSLKSWGRLLLPMSLALILAPQAALALLFPVEYQQGVTPLRLAAAGGALLSLVTLLNGVYQAAGDRRRPALIATIALIVQVAILILFTSRWDTSAAAFSLLAAGLTAVAGLALTVPGLNLYLRNLLSSRAWRKNILWPAIWQAVIPLAALAAPLILLPDGGRVAAIIKLGCAGVLYLIALAVVNLKPGIVTERPVKGLVIQFLQVLMGGY